MNPFDKVADNTCWQVSQIVIVIRVLLACSLKTGTLTDSDDNVWSLVASALIILDVAVILTAVASFLLGLTQIGVRSEKVKHDMEGVKSMELA